ncbi:EamA family transporter [Herbiconiux sp. 11R-BC]|uniref:DMT family transporter n=1 Tax=Herbiconiux sp. 11R-BC TaxID=3111637 RepID=UPI003C007E6F
MMPFLAVIVAALCFGTTGTAQAFAPADASAFSLGAARILIGGGLLAIVAGLMALRHRMREARSPVTAGARAAGRPSGASANGASTASGAHRRSWPFVVVGALGVVAYQPAFFAGTHLNGVAIGTVVALGSAPVITGLLDGILNRRFPGRRWLIATAIALVGVTLISGLVGTGSAAAGAAAGSGGVSIPGLLASLGAGASYAVYTLASKALLDRGFSPSATMGGVFGVAAAFSLPILLLTDTRWLGTGPGLLAALWLGVVTTAVAYTLFAWGLDRLTAATVSTLTLAEPLLATVLGTFVLGQSLAPVAVAGLVVLAVGILVLTLPGRGRREEFSEPAASS